MEWKSADADDQQAKLNVVRDVFAEKYPMISGLKQAIAIYANDPAWRTVRPPLVELTAEQAKTLTAELKATGFTVEVDPPPSRDRGTTARPAFVRLRHGKRDGVTGKWRR